MVCVIDGMCVRVVPATGEEGQESGSRGIKRIMYVRHGPWPRGVTEERSRGFMEERSRGFMDLGQEGHGPGPNISLRRHSA